jgi:D-alanyl-D-alanine carboxypeptidase
MVGLGHTTLWLHRDHGRLTFRELAMPDHPPAFQQHIQQELDRLVAGGLPGAFVYVEDADGTSTFRTAGVADLASGARMTPGMHYRIGSTTKTFTAVVVLQLIAAGRLALGDLVRDRLPDRPIPHGDRLTVEHLLRMRSGLLDFEDHPSLRGDLEAHLRPVSLARVLEFALGGPPSFAPGAHFAYCNSNFCLLEAIVERATGRSLGAELRERIFEPVGLARTRYPPEDDLSLPEPYIRGYDHTGAGWRECSRAFFGRGDGAIVSTAADTARFLRALLVERTLVPPELLAQMMSVVPDEPPARFAYGLGLIAHPTACGPVWGHSGDGFGYAHAPFVRVETGRVAIIMRNASFGYGPTRNEALSQQLSFTPEFRSSLYC